MKFLIAIVTLLGLLRAAAVVTHDPLLAYANSYDEVRYTACFDLYPDRPRAIPPTDNSPWAPFSGYAFVDRAGEAPMCYWSSELLPQGLIVAAWKLVEAAGGDRQHSVRALGDLKLALLLLLNITFSIAWWRRRQPAGALANAALLACVFADPANTLYANTFYAEWSALLALYATITLALLFAEHQPTRTRALLLAGAALLLGTSKVQHLLLPLLLAGIVLLLGWLRSRLDRDDITLDLDEHDTLEGIDLDGKPAPFPPGDPPMPSDVLSDELDRFTRDPVYEAAVRAAAA